MNAATTATSTLTLPPAPKTETLKGDAAIEAAKKQAQEIERLKRAGKIKPEDEGYWSTPVEGQPKDPIPDVKDTNGVLIKEGDIVEFSGVLGGKGTGKVNWVGPYIANASGELQPGFWAANGVLRSDGTPLTIVERDGKPFNPPPTETPTQQPEGQQVLSKKRFDKQYTDRVRPSIVNMLLNSDNSSKVITEAAGRKLTTEQEADVVIEWMQQLREKGEMVLANDFASLTMEQAYFVEPALKASGLLEESTKVETPTQQTEGQQEVGEAENLRPVESVVQPTPATATNPKEDRVTQILSADVIPTRKETGGYLSVSDIPQVAPIKPLKSPPYKEAKTEAAKLEAIYPVSSKDKTRPALNAVYV